MCMVEISTTSPLDIACAASLLQNMNISTESVSIARGREYILEFLLLNHPLDCPICDRGSECDLQEQANRYGNDCSKFVENKRSVQDKEIGFFVKTVMTRCIHCTRCIRFLDDIANDNILGTIGRGGETEIGTYLSKFLNNPLSGNIIDLCPVGALLSKPYNYLTRS